MSRIRILFATLNFAFLTVWGCAQGQELAWLKVQGCGIVDSQGQPVTLRGLGLTNGVYTVPAPASLAGSRYDLTEQDYQTMRALGANVVRFYLQYEWLEAEHRADLFEYLDRQIQYASRNGVYIILNLHYFGMAESVNMETDDGFYAGDKNDNQYDVAGFWLRISDRYKHEPAIAAYDLLNEPTCHDAFTEQELYQLYQQIVDRLRANHDRHILVVADPVMKYHQRQAAYHGLPGPFQKLPDDNVVYEFHWYIPFEFTSQCFFPNSYCELGATYPSLRREGPYLGGYYGNPYWKETPDGEWQYYEGNWVDFSRDATCPPGPDSAFNPLLSAARIDGTVWFDDVRLERRHVPTGRIETIPVANASFALPRNYKGWRPDPAPSEFPARWYALANAETQSVGFYWDKNEDHTGDGSGSLAIDGRNATWAGDTIYARWSQSGGALPACFPIEQDYVYRSSAWIKIKNTSTYCVNIGYDIIQARETVTDKAAMQEAISSYYAEWARQQQVPLFCGEFGTNNPSNRVPDFPGSPQQQILWIRDMLQILNASGIHWAYHGYKNYSDRGDLGGLFDAGYEDRPLQDALRPGFGQKTAFPPGNGRMSRVTE